MENIAQFPIIVNLLTLPSDHVFTLSGVVPRTISPENRIGITLGIFNFDMSTNVNYINSKTQFFHWHI